MTTVSLEEKRLRQLKQQLFGKADLSPIKITPQQLKDVTEVKTVTVSASTLESVNLRSDLLKIVILSAAAISIQLSLFFASSHGLIKLFR